MMEIKYSNVFKRNYESKAKIVINRGGTRAGKTYSLMQLAVIWLLTGKIREGQIIEKGTLSVVRKTLPALKATAQKDFDEILDSLNARHLVKENKTDRYYEYEGRIVEFFSVDDQQKVRGRKRNILFCNEANELNYQSDFFQLLIRTTDLIFIDFNPSDPYIWIRTELEEKRAAERGDVETIISTYKDNPFLSEELKNEIESISDPQLRKVYVDGEYGIVEGVIFPRVTIIDEFPSFAEKVGNGVDFGFVQDPTAIMLCGVKGKKIFIHELCYERGLTSGKMAKILVPYNKHESICDSAQPITIAELRGHGIQAIPCIKGKDSIISGINLLKEYEICITGTSTNLLIEQKRYKWAVDRVTGQFTNKPIDAFNHGWDAVRYWASRKLSIRNQNTTLAYG